MWVLKGILGFLWQVVKQMSLIGALMIWLITSANVFAQVSKVIGPPDSIGEYMAPFILFLGIFVPMYLIVKPLLTKKEKDVEDE